MYFFGLAVLLVFTVVKFKNDIVGPLCSGSIIVLDKIEVDVIYSNTTHGGRLLDLRFQEMAMQLPPNTPYNRGLCPVRLSM